MDLNNPYKREDFVNFLRAFLPDNFRYEEEHVPVDTRVIKSCTFLGTSSLGKSSNLNIYEFEHESERDPRITITKEIFKFMKDNIIDNVLAVVKSKNSQNYRLSLVTIDYTLSDKGIKEEKSNPRRYSFFLGPQAKVRTPEQILIKKGAIKDLEDLKSRFSIEVVNKEFYQNISKLFNELVENIKLPDGADNEQKQNFAVRLIGRTIFCWFLKKKTVNGKSLISDEILSKNAVKNAIQNGNDYFHTILETLFFQILNTPIEQRKIKDYNDIPFLNGGLFEPKTDDYYEFDDATQLSRYINTVKISNEWFDQFFDVLETYNFTIDESTPFDVELSVDPEMLGRVFENLLAEINPETGESARHSTGSYYTPRQIVDYMVDESLKHYLIDKTSLDEKTIENLLSYHEDTVDIDDKIKEKIINAIDDLRIIDPACGSGAFPMGILQKLSWILHKVDPDASKWKEKQFERLEPVVRKIFEDKLKGENEEFTRKLGLIERTIYGVDVQEIAVEIAKLRVFLSLIVDSNIDSSKDNMGIKPLPNLEFKFVCADTLRKLPESMLFENEKMIEELKKIREKYFTSYGQEKQNLEKQFKQVQNKMFNEYIKLGSYETKTRMLSYWDPFSSKPSDWFDPEWMFGVKDGFDIVIGNPPYIQLQKDHGALAKRYEDQNFKTYKRTGDIYTLFYERGLQLLKENGYLCFITSNKWMRAGYGETLRTFFLTQNPLILIDLGPGVFESSTVDTNILLMQKTENKNQFKGVTLKSKNDAQNLSNFVETNAILLPKMNNGAWFIGNDVERRLKEKIEKIGKPLKEWDVKIYYGIKTGLNEAFIITTEKRDEILANCKTEEERKRTEAIIKPILRGRDIKRYYYEWAGLWVIVIPAGWTNKNKCNESAESFIEKTFPALMKHLNLFKNKAEKRDDQGDYWWELRHCAYYPEFEKEKVVWQELAQGSQFAFDANGDFFVSNT
ncbi:Eco57I restriction-modification methylase domain-containing protein, partial [Athalassotoga sp.]|uniref:Eco57I restriction-modification methylase domain-containing protein n=1 Tax=Athalassotoga sp. TaxID=2022597 RepID=UPI003D04CB23